MSARFRVRTPQGQELSFGSEEMFADFVRSGELSPGDLVYDATSGEWSPALTHSLVLELSAESEEDVEEGDRGRHAEGRVVANENRVDPDAPPDEPPGADPESGKTPPDTDEDESGVMGFELAPEMTPEEAAAAFLEQLHAEREAELDATPVVEGLRVEGPEGGLIESAFEHGQEDRATTDARTERDGPAPPEPSPLGPKGSRTSAASPSRTARTRRTSRGFPVWAWVAAVLVVGVLLGPELVGLAMGPPDLGPLPEEAGPPILADTEEALRARAEVGFLARVRDRLSRLPEIPRIWLDGRYLAGASAYPGVRAVWADYLDTVRDLRAAEDQIYSEAYLSALDDARVTGSARTLRLASAISRFEIEGAERDEHYRRVLDLATAALRLHDLLLELEADITYEPAVGERLSSDPVLQAAGRTPEVQQRMEGALDAVLAALSARREGPIEARAVPEWFFDGLRDVVVSTP